MVAAIRADGRPQMTPNWFYWDGSKFYISTTKRRRRYTNFLRDPRVQLAFDDPAGFKTVLVDGTVEVRENIAEQLSHFKAIRAKHGRNLEDDATMHEGLLKEDRVLLAITPDKPIDEWTRWGR